jgi:DNA invertase Pin-like site-specific DNA recombinase
LLNRPALVEMLVDLEENGHGIKTVIIEKMDRLARDLLIQETIISDFREKGISLISAVEGSDLLDVDPTRQLVRQVLGAISEYEKTMLVQKLRVARKRKKAKTGKCEGRKSYGEAAPEVVKHIQKLRRKQKGRNRKSFREIAEQLNLEGISTLNGQEWTLQTVRNVLK